MATTLYRSPSCSLLLPSSRKLFFLKQPDFRPSFITYFRSRRKSLRICACSAKKPRRRGNVKSNEELCNEIREFISAVGLPEGHFPTTKEFAAHGRTDLANIVRRRGYKVVRDLLANSMSANTSDMEQSEAEQRDDIAEGQDENSGNVVDDSSSNDYSSSAGFNFESSYSEHAHVSPESSLDESSNAEWKTYKVTGSVKDFKSSTTSHDIGRQNEEIHDGFEHDSSSKPFNKVEHEDEEVLSTDEEKSPAREVLIMVKFHDELNLNSETNSDANACLSEEKAPKISLNQDEKANIMDDDELKAAGVSDFEYPTNNTNVVPGLDPNDHNFKPRDLATNTSLEDKVAKFIQDGDLDTIDDDIYHTLDERTEESERIGTPSFKPEIEWKCPYEENFEDAVIRSDAASVLNGSISEQSRLPARDYRAIRKDDLAVEDVASSDIKDMDDEIGKSENDNQINRLKFLLHQKELELSRLKDQIEKEQLSLSNLQVKTETEILKAQKFISEKESELLAAEESLAGLVEVNIQYRGEGEIVEVAGSFNGWHHPIKMDPQPLFSTGSRKFRLWSTMLWLYPGVYEIKFIVDGEWTVDEERESIIRGGICNNILRVSR